MNIITTDQFAMEQEPDDEDPEYLAVRAGAAGAAVGASRLGKGEPDVDESVALIEARVDPAEWKLEVERVGPKLKITLAADTKVKMGRPPIRILQGDWGSP